MAQLPTLYDLRILNLCASSESLSIAQEPYQHHASIGAILSKAHKISSDLGIVLDDFYSGYASMASYLFPTAAVNKVVSVTLFFNMLYFIDDVFGEDVARGEASLVKSRLFPLFEKIWMTGSLSNLSIESEAIRNLAQAIAYVSNDIQSNSPPTFFSQLTFALTEHIKHVLFPDEYTTLDQYISTRACFGGMYPTLHMIEYTTGHYLNNTITDMPAFQKVQSSCVDIGGLSNDILSYPKEIHSRFNLVSALLELGLVSDLREAILKSIDIVNRRHAAFRKAADEYRLQAQELVSEQDRIIADSYMQGLQNTVSASYHWQLHTRRYNHECHFFSDFQPDFPEPEIATSE